MDGFRGLRKGRVGARFAASQAGIIRGLVIQVAELVGGDPEHLPTPPAPGSAGPADPLEGLSGLLGAGPDHPPEDPVLARLLPDAYADDAAAAGEFRRFTEQDLRSGKLAAARTVLDTLPAEGGRVELSGEEAQVWLRALNDVRLALGVRLSITEDYDQRVTDLDPADPRAAYLWVYDWLTYLQETLVRALW